MNLHPGARAALARIGANELGIARMMAAGDLTSPQQYQNVTLYNIRITGTGVSYRPSLDEFVFRRPEHYLTEEFVARCNGLPVIMIHPDESLLTSEEFAKRIVGTVFLPYIKGDDVWAIAKLYDADAIEMLAEQQMSTSPAVLLGPSKKYKDEDGNQIIDESDPVLLDHIAIVRNGVWDCGGPPTGIMQNLDEVRADSIASKKLDDAAHKLWMLRLDTGGLKYRFNKRKS